MMAEETDEISLVQELDRPPDPEEEVPRFPIPVLLPSPPSDYWFGGQFHQDRNYDHEGAQDARRTAQELIRHPDSPLESVPSPPPARFWFGGVPTIFDGTLDAPVSFDDAEAPKRLAEAWLMARDRIHILRRVVPSPLEQAFPSDGTINRFEIPQLRDRWQPPVLEKLPELPHLPTRKSRFYLSLPSIPKQREISLFRKTRGGKQLLYRPKARLRRVLAITTPTGEMAEVVYQQYHEGQDPKDPSKSERWPVFGAQMVIHLQENSSRVTATSSFFPLRTDAEFTCTIDEEQAKALARQVLVAYLTPEEAPGLYWCIIEPWLNESEPGRLASHYPVETGVAQKLMDFLRSRSEGARKLPPSSDVEAVWNYLRFLRERLEIAGDSDLAKWVLYTVPVAKSVRFIFPFANRYFLAYQIEAISPGRDQSWRIFVDASRGLILGHPEDRLFHSKLISLTSKEADAANEGRLIGDMTLPWLALPKFIELKTRDGATEETWTIESKTEDGATEEASTKKKLNKRLMESETIPSPLAEAVNIVYHANEFYKYFTEQCGAPGDIFKGYTYEDKEWDDAMGRWKPVVKEQKGITLSLIVDKAPDQGKGTFFNPDENLHPKQIIFDGLGEVRVPSGREGIIKVIRNRCRDPEVIYHEMAHALMWLFHKSPFEQPDSTAPFSKALLEGYATYFARSLAARHMQEEKDPDKPWPWASSAYRKAEWETVWGFARSIKEVGEDLLPYPNLYPPRFDPIEDPLYPYRRGMVWARALWDIRTFLRDRNITDYARLADQLALGGYRYTYGYITNFEQAAEGILRVARKKLEGDNQLPTDLCDAIQQCFYQRRILAQQGVQALLRVANPQGGWYLLKGSDAGIKRSTDDGTIDDGTTWGSLPGIIALALWNTDTIVAATEQGIYQRKLDGSGWTLLGDEEQWLTARPLSLCHVNGNILVGTNDGIRRLRGNRWEYWGQDDNASDPLREVLRRVVWQIIYDPSPPGYLYVTQVNKLRDHLLTPEGPAWGDANFSEKEAKLPVALALHKNSLYVGTLLDGIWKQIIESVRPDGVIAARSWKEVALPRHFNKPPLIDEKRPWFAVLHLAANASRLFAGTTWGVYEIPDSLPPNGLNQVPGSPNEAITSLVVGESHLWAGTASGEVRRCTLP